MKIRYCLGLLWAAFSSYPLTAMAASGVYEQLLLAITPNGTVQGLFNNTSGQGVTQTCKIFFAGAAVEGSTIPLKTWDAKGSKGSGSLNLNSQAVTFSAKNYRQFAGCGMAGDPDLETGEEFELTRATAWTALERISAAKAYLHGAAGDAKQPRSYVVKGDIVGLLGTASGWLHVEYVLPTDTSKSVEGWIKAEEAESLSLP